MTDYVKCGWEVKCGRTSSILKSHWITKSLFLTVVIPDTVSTRDTIFSSWSMWIQVPWSYAVHVPIPVAPESIIKGQQSLSAKPLKSAWVGNHMVVHRYISNAHKHFPSPLTTHKHTHIHTYTQSQTWHLSFYMQRMVYSSCPCSGKPEKCFLWKITLVVGITVVSLLLLWIACFRFYFNYFTYVILSNPYDILWGWYYHYSFFWEANTYIFHFNPVRLVLISPWFSDEGIKP